MDMNNSLSARPSWPARLADYARRYRHLLAAISFASGLASFILIERQNALAQWITVVLLVSWLGLLLEGAISSLAYRLSGYELPPVMVRMTYQAIHQETFFFVLPFYLASTSWWTGQALFTGLLIIAAGVSLVDPLYYDRLAQSRRLYYAYHTFALFVATIVGMPILISLTTEQTLMLACGGIAFFALPSLAATLEARPWRWLLLIILSLVLAAGAWLAKPWIPPATLRVAESAVSLALDRLEREPGQDLERIPRGMLGEDGVYVYTAIRAPLGLRETIYHVWRHQGEVTDRISLEISGGREQGYRAWSHKQHFPEDATGRWAVTVETAAGQRIGRVAFSVE